MGGFILAKHYILITNKIEYFIRTKSALLWKEPCA